MFAVVLQLGLPGCCRGWMLKIHGPGVRRASCTILRCGFSNNFLASVTHAKLAASICHHSSSSLTAPSRHKSSCVSQWVNYISFVLSGPLHPPKLQSLEAVPGRLVARDGAWDASDHERLHRFKIQYPSKCRPHRQPEP